MGQKINPISFRLGINQTFRSRWYADKKEFGTLLVADQAIRRHILKNYAFAGIPRIDIERTSGAIKLTLHCARPGVIIGRKGQEIDRLRGEVEQISACTVEIDVKEIDRPDMNAALIGQSISEQLKKRGSFRRALKKAADTAMQVGAQGVKIEIAGRLGGSEMRRRERVVNGMIPLHTLDADIDYALTTCVTKSGTIGVKVWVYRGQTAPMAPVRDAAEPSTAGGVA